LRDHFTRKPVGQLCDEGRASTGSGEEFFRRHTIVGPGIIHFHMLFQKLDGFGVDSFGNENFHKIGEIMAQLGFLGLGIMGYPMARNLLKAGHSVAIWSHTRAKVDQLAKEAGGRGCVTPMEVAEHSDVVFLCVGDTAMSEKVTLGAQGLVQGAKPGSVFVDCSTVAPEYARRAAHTLAAKQIGFIDAPCTGSRPGAEGGTLTFMVGGDPACGEREAALAAVLTAMLKASCSASRPSCTPYEQAWASLLRNDQPA